MVTNKTRVVKFPFPALLVTSWKAQYVTGYSVVLPNGSHLSCLLRADDLVLIQQSAEGLENALSILSEYCEHWLLSVNPKKKKIIMIFEKKYRKSTLNSRWLEAIYMRVGYVFDLRFSE